MSNNTIYPSLENKSVYITGGATGIGAALVKAFARQKSKVTFVDIEQQAAQTLVQKVQEMYGVEVYFENVDVTNTESLQQSIRVATQRQGGLDVLINNVANDMRHAPDQVTVQEWHRCMAINLDPAFFASQIAFSMMKDTQSGSIINFSSINALIGLQQMVGYNTAKAGLVGMTKSLAKDFGGYGIRVNAILPGWVATDKQLNSWLTEEEEKKWMAQMAIKERITPSQVAKLALFLASDDSEMVTGQSISIDGGRT